NAKLVVGMPGQFDNVWYHASGQSLAFEPGVDTNLRATVALGNGKLEVRANADGLANHKMIGWNDWEVLGNETCLTTASSGDGTNPVQCHPWKWEPDGYGVELRVRALPRVCLHKQYGNWDNGNPIHTWSCEAGSSEMKTWIWERSTGYIR